MNIRLNFYEAATKVTAGKLKSLIPVTFPTTHVLDPKLFTGAAKFPVDEWNRKGKHMFSCKLDLTLHEVIPA